MAEERPSITIEIPLPRALHDRLETTVGERVDDLVGPWIRSLETAERIRWGVAAVLVLPVVWALAPLLGPAHASPLLLDGVALPAILLPGLLATLAGTLLLGYGDRPEAPRFGSWIVASVLLLPIVVFFLTIPFGVGTRQEAWWVWDPPSALVDAVYVVLGAAVLVAPAALLGAVAMAVWPWTGRPARAGLAVGVLVALGWGVLWVVDTPHPRNEVFSYLSVAALLQVGSVAYEAVGLGTGDLADVGVQETGS